MGKMLEVVQGAQFLMVLTVVRPLSEREGPVNKGARFEIRVKQWTAWEMIDEKDGVGAKAHYGSFSGF